MERKWSFWVGVANSGFIRLDDKDELDVVPESVLYYMDEVMGELQSHDEITALKLRLQYTVMDKSKWTAEKK